MSALTREAELSALIAEQKKDAQWGHRVDSKALSLDYTTDSGASFDEIVGSTDTTLDAFLGDNENVIRRMPRRQAWTRRAILNAIQAWAKEHGEPPLYKEWKCPNGRGVPSTASVARRFGSWSAAIEAAGFEPRPVGGTSHPQELQHKRFIRRIRNRKRTAHLTVEQIAAAYVLYERHHLSTTQLAERLFRKYGYANVYSCRAALLRAFHAEGWRLRSRRESLVLWHRNKGHQSRLAA